MPLNPSAGVSGNIREFHKGPTFAHTAKKFGRSDANRQAVAVAFNVARKARRRADGGPATDNDGAQVNVVQAPAPENFQSTTDAISKSYPALQPYVKNLSIQRGTASGPDDDRQLEFYQPWESENPNPGKITTELYNPSLQGQDLQEAVAGDMLHHLGATDPTTNQPVNSDWMGLKQQMIGAMGPDQKSMDQGAYQQEKLNPSYQTGSYDDWMQNNRADAYIRGALFPNQNPEWQEEGVYTPAMKEVAKKMQKYLATAPDNNKRRGGAVSAALDIARKVRAKGGRVHVGPIIGKTGGRADKRPMHVPDGAYVMTADHVSGLGQGNTHAGMAVLDKMFPISAKAHTDEMPAKRAVGGKVPIYAADGEYVVHPQDIKDRYGDLDRGHKVLDAWQTHERQNLIKTLSSLDPPAQD